MKKKMIAITSAAILALSLSATSLAAELISPPTSYGGSSSFCGGGGGGRGGFCGGGYSLMWDQDGNFLDKDEFEANLDKLIEDGYILSENRDYFIDRYDWCSTNGGGATGVCGGGGRGMGMYR